MPEISGPYDSYYIQPIARIRENISLFTVGKWHHYMVDYQNPIPPTPASIVEMVAAVGLTTLAAGAAIAKRVVTILQLSDYEFLHLRWKPLDYVEGLLYEIAGSQHLNATNIHSRVDPFVGDLDPTWASTTFWILGSQRDMQLEVRNPMQYATPVARFQFWGNRSYLTEFDASGRLQAEKDALAAGDRETVRRIIGPTVWVPAEGRV